MKAKLYQLPSLLNKLNNPYLAVIFYGTDEGEIQKGFQTVVSFLKIDLNDFNVTRITPENIKKNPLALTDEANTVSLMGGKRVLIVDEEIGLTDSSLTHFLDNNKTDALLIIKGGNLPKNSSLRVEAESNPFVLAFACYPPTESEIQKNILSFLTKEKKSISPADLKYLTQKLSSNAGIIQQELDKLLIYLTDKKTVSIQDIDEIITDTGDASLDTFCISLASGNTAKIEHDLFVFIHQNDSIAPVINSMARYFTVLGKLVESKNSLDAQESILKTELKPNQFKLKEPLMSQAQFWHSSGIINVLHEIAKLEKQTRQTGVPAECVFSNTCIRISEFAKKLRSLR